MCKQLFFVILLVLVLASNGLGTTYYADFDGGSDTNSGLSTSQAWKHCPCDDNATGIPAAITLAGGDTVIFKGGVHYRGEIKANVSGNLGDPIVFDGDTAQSWGSGKAVIDGSEPLTGWTPCSSAEDCGGAANWANMYKTTLGGSVDKDVWKVNLMEDDVLLAVAQGPTAPDPFFYDKTSSYNAVPPSDATSTSIVDASFFTQPGADAWDGAYIHVWAQGNQVYTSKVTGYSPSTHTIYFETLPNLPYTQYDTRYAMGNSVEVLDAAGEYVVDESSGEVYLWPYTGGDIGSVEITVSVRMNGFDFRGKSNITLQGLKIIKFSAGFDEYHNGAGIKNTTSGASNLIVRDNEVAYNRSMTKFAGIDLRGSTSNVTVENNYIHRNLRSRGLLTGGSNVTLANNTLVKNGGTGIYMGGANNVDVIGNSVLDHTGVHANGITAYQNSSNILIFGNTVLRGNCALTTQASDSITIAYNILHKYGGGYCVADWTWDYLHSTNLHYYNNVILNGGPPALYTGGTGLIVTNNIIDGWGGNGTYNIYTSPESLGVGEMIEEDKSKIFVDPDNLDFHLRPDSPAIDAGIDVGFDRDKDGVSVPWGDAPDIGAYECEYIIPPVGDFTGNGVVDFEDVKIIAEQWLVDEFVLDGLVSYYKFDGDADDNVGGNDGTEVGNPTYSTGLHGQAISLDGDGDYVNCGSDASFDITGSITLSALIKGTFNSGWDGIITRGYDWMLSRGTGDEAVFFCIGVGSALGSTNINDDQWHHVAGVYDGSKMYLYVDGKLNASGSASGSLYVSAANVYIGGSPSQSFNGLIDDVRIYNRALSEDEIETLYSGPPTDLVNDFNIDFRDFSVLAEHWLEDAQQP